jgi:hypothetical protein
MARYVIEQRIDQVDGLKDFALEGYQFSPAQSSSAQLVFLRNTQ